MPLGLGLGEKEMDPGVKPLRGRARSNSGGGARSEYPPTNPSAAPTGETEEIAASSSATAKRVLASTTSSSITNATGAGTWGSEDEKELEKKAETWRRLRQDQQKEVDALVSWKDAAVGVLGVLAFRQAARAAGFSGRKAAMYLFLGWLVRTIWRNRAPQPLLKRHPKARPSYPIIGMFPHVLRAISMGFVQFQLESARLVEFSTGEMVSFGGLREVVLMDPNDREYLLRTNWRNFTKNAPGATSIIDAFAEIFGRGIFAVDGDEWTAHRKVASHLFSTNGLKTKMERSFHAHADILTKHFALKAQSNQPFDFQEAMQAFTFDSISDIAFGFEPGSLEASLRDGVKVDFLVRFDRVQQHSGLRLAFPEGVWRTLRWLNVGPERQMREDSTKVRAYVQRIVEEKKRALVSSSSSSSSSSGADGSESASGDDLLTLYIKTAKAMHKPHMMDDDYLNDATLNFMVAGRDTTSSTLISMFRRLAENPSVAAKMRAEFDAVVGPHGRVEWDSIRDLRYASAVFNEVLRMHPPVPFDFKICNQDCTLPSGVFVPAGTRVGIPNSSIGRDPKLWRDADEFRPERWLDPAHPDQPVRRVDEYIHPVFWGGPRLCLGKDMARLEALIVAHTILKDFDVQVLPGQSPKIANGVVQFLEEGLKVRVVPRSSSSSS